jgi:cell division protein FtsN
MESMKQQRGGTLLGFIIGMVVGLGVALAVAVYVTKVPVPFVNKGQSRSADQDAAETQKNKDWDPNTPLYGKNPAKPSAQGASAPATTSNAEQAAPAAPAAAVKATPTGKSTPTPEASTAATPASAAKAAAKPPSASTDPLGDLVKSRAAATSAEPFAYFVQVGAFRTSEDAESQRAKLSLGGVETKVTEREQSGRTVYRVRVGPFDKKDDADKSKEKLDASGLETALVRVQR